MNRYQVLIEYEGTKFFGWQIQKNVNTIQKLVQSKISKILKEKIHLIGSGRTDSGVHAWEQSAHFDSKKKIINYDKFIKSLNFFLNKKLISITKLKKKNINFHARYSAKERIYEYVIINRLAPPSIEKNKVWHIRRKLNLEMMKKGSKILSGTHNFSTFRATNCYSKSPIRTLKRIKIIKINHKIIIQFKSKSFLRNQVRSMVGCLKYLGEKKWSLKKFKEAFSSNNRSLCAPPAPPEGLYLVKVNY